MTYIDSMVLENLVTSILSILLSAAMSLILVDMRRCSEKEKKRDELNPEECLARLKTPFGG